jgi:hypothetical protein
MGWKDTRRGLRSDASRIKKDFRRGGSYPPPEVRHGTKPFDRIISRAPRSILGGESADYNHAHMQCQSIVRPRKSKCFINITNSAEKTYENIANHVFRCVLTSNSVDFFTLDRYKPPHDEAD